MAKFYVRSGNVAEVVDAEDRDEAVRKAIFKKAQKNDGKVGLAVKILVSEQGFSIDNPDVTYVLTDKVMRELGFFKGEFLDENNEDWN